MGDAGGDWGSMVGLGDRVGDFRDPPRDGARGERGSRGDGADIGCLGYVVALVGLGAALQDCSQDRALDALRDRVNRQAIAIERLERAVPLPQPEAPK